MELELKRDFEKARDRWNKYWAGKSTDRPVVCMSLPKEGVEPVPRPHPYHMLKEDLNGFIDKVLRSLRSYHWFGDAVPSYQITFAPDHFALLLGAEIRDNEETGETVWVVPFLDNYSQNIRFRPEGKYWQKTVECVEAFRKHCDGIFVTSWTQLQGGLDALAAIRGPERLLMDMVMCPDDVRNALTQISKAMNEARAAFADILDASTYGTTTRHGMYCSGLVDVPQCDLSAMIGPEMFREFGLPSLQRECKTLDAVEYHLDGTDAIKHLPALTEVKQIKTIQWQPGAGKAQTMDWTHLYQQIDDLGFGQYRVGTKEKVKTMWRQYKNRAYLYISNVTDITSFQEAEEFLAELQATRVG